jgi:polysaccharide export outer membrane protein
MFSLAARKNEEGGIRIAARFYKHFVPPAQKSIALGLLALVITLSAHGQQGNSNAAAPEVPATKSNNDLYRIGPGDVLDVRVFNRPQLSRDAVRVDNRGMIRMPMIDSEIHAGCRTESELSEELAALYLKYQRHPHVDVFIKEYSSKPVAVMGAVDKPGQFQLQRRVRLLELVSLAGGPTERAGQRILVAHSTEISTCEESAAASASGFESYDLDKTLKADSVSNPYVHAGDIITVPEAQLVFVVGNVFRPTSIPLKERITLSQAVAMAGGTMPDSKKESIRVLRQLPGSTAKTEIVVDLNAISRRKADDLELMPNDIIDVPTSSGKRFLRTVLSAVAPAVSSLPIRVVP